MTGSDAAAGALSAADVRWRLLASAAERAALFLAPASWEVIGKPCGRRPLLDDQRGRQSCCTASRRRLRAGSSGPSSTSGAVICRSTWTTTWSLPSTDSFAPATRPGSSRRIQCRRARRCGILADMQPEHPVGRAPALARARHFLIAGAGLVVLGILLIPLPGPGVVVLALSAPVLVAGVVLAARDRRSAAAGGT